MKKKKLSLKTWSSTTVKTWGVFQCQCSHKFWKYINQEGFSFCIKVGKSASHFNWGLIRVSVWEVKHASAQNQAWGRKRFKQEEGIPDSVWLTDFGLSAVGLDQRTQQERSHRRGPLPDLLPQTEHLSRLSSPPRGPDDGTLQLRVRRVAIQLRTIGDEFNATLLHRAVSVATESPLWFQRGTAADARVAFLNST